MLLTVTVGRNTSTALYRVEWQPGTGRLASADGNGVVHRWQPAG
ncbi:hypothetical protein KZZ52_13500 [Dactylosporangium sp. AC04546]|nr:hypothetical protein [Dactylosporangium sp. AC04546]WVK86342.1 hypothetical protein KZZ52_13500 [Dactylosporangium sp. AC04546]